MVDFEAIVAGYAPHSESDIKGRGLAIRAVGYSAGMLLFRGRTAAAQVPHNSRPSDIHVALFELTGRGAIDYHCLVNKAGKLSVLMASVNSVAYLPGGGLHIPDMGLMTAPPDSARPSKLGLVYLESLPVPPTHLSLSELVAAQPGS